MSLSKDLVFMSQQRNHDNDDDDDVITVLGEASSLLQKIEQNVPRAFLKPPLVRKGGASEFNNLPSLSESGFVFLNYLNSNLLVFVKF